MGTEDDLPTNGPESVSKSVNQPAVEEAAGSSSSDPPKDQIRPAVPTSTLTSENVNAHAVNGGCQGSPCRSEDGDNSSDVSEISDLSHESWQPVQGPISWVHEQMRKGQSPRSILEKLVPKGTVIPEGLDVVTLWKIIISIVSEPPRRKKLDGINTLDDVIQLLKTCKKIIVLTGAGVSVSCGIPDFRSKDGVYARLAKDFPNLPDPQAMFDIHFFRSDPRPFYKFAKEIYPGQFNPSLCHHFIRLLETKGKLLRNYTQNIDTLEQEAGIERVVQCHGSFATASCAVCGYKVNSSIIKEDIFKQIIPRCPHCPADNEQAVMKPDIVFFGESLPEHFHNLMTADKEECDLLIVIGSSLKVRPVALIPNSLPAGVPQILINRERLHYLNFDVELLGNCDNIVAELCRRLGETWDHVVPQEPLLEQAKKQKLLNDAADSSCSNPQTSEGSLITSSDSHAKDETHKTVDGAATNFEVSKGNSGKNEANCMDGLDEKDGNSPQSDDEPGDSIEDLQRAWSERPRVSIAERLAEHQVLFIPPSRYIFKGAEVYSDESESEDDEDSENEDEENTNENGEEMSSRDVEESSSREVDESSSREVEESGSREVEESSSREVDGADQRSTMSSSDNIHSTEESSGASAESQQAGDSTQGSRETSAARRVHNGTTGVATLEESSSSAADASSSVSEGNVDALETSGGRQEKADCAVTSSGDLS
ncbi:hypothetical protein EGW08_002135 [Elysia chlorotica]|uniref:protein acetyllysine N-acetyltransferase n=1 Tax=Elysia chlorotica TaxID=188477 RepID=A0A433U8F0_ELYCH|nr:hypothetical protein EGW08_002135 [Elysia chlorotica]